MLKDHFESLLRELFPAQASFRLIDLHTEELVYRADWKIPAEDGRMKYARPVQIHFSPDTLDDYEDARASERHQMDLRVLQLVAEMLNSFEPEHNVPRYQRVPEEKWHITPDLISY